MKMNGRSKRDTPGLGRDEIAWLTATELVSAFKTRSLSPLEVTKAILARIERLDPLLKAFVLVDSEGALAAASKAEARWAGGRPLGLLDGVPVSIKDIVLTRGLPTRRGSRLIDPDQAWDEDGPAVARLREAGAVILGKTTTPEFAAKPVTISPLTGTTRNPWNLAYSPGGSSGGAGAAVAAGLGPLALGTDAGGSIRIPASLCGVFGFKPSGGRVPMYPPTPYGTLASFGPMTRSVVDAALMLSVIARPDPRDWSALPYQKIDYPALLQRANLQQWRIAWSPTLGYARVDPEVADLAEAAVERLAEWGARIEKVESVFEDPATFLETFKHGLTDYAFRHLDERSLEQMDPDLAEEIRQSRGASLRAHLDAEMARAALGRRMCAFHQDYDLLLTPTLAGPPFPVELQSPEGYGRYEWLAFSYPFNLTRQPAASLPCGFTDAGLPVGLQIVGPMYADLLVLQAAHAFERILPWADRRPNLEPSE